MHLIIFFDSKRNWYNCALSLYSVWRLFYCNFCCKWSVCTTLYVNKPDYYLICYSFSCFWQKLIFALCFQMNQLLKPTVSWVSLLGALNVVVANVWLPLCVCVCCTCTAWSFTYLFSVLPVFLCFRSGYHLQDMQPTLLSSTSWTWQYAQSLWNMLISLWNVR